MGCAQSSGSSAPSAPEARAPKNSAPVASRGRWTDLHEQAELGNESQVRAEAQRNDVNMGDENCWTALLEACEKKHVGCVDALLQAKANPNLADKKGWTPIMAAAEGGSAKVAQSLLRAKANVDYQDKKGWTCIMEAAERGNAAMVKEFVKVAGVDSLNQKDDKGWTPFMAAAEGGNVDCVKLLWIHGAEHNTTDHSNWTAIEEAKEKGNKTIVAFMEPILEAEKNLMKMVETDDWKVEDALQYLEKAQQVWCLKGLVDTALLRLTTVLQQKILDQAAKDREQCFDWYVNMGANENKSYTNNNPGNNTDEQLKAAMADICRSRLTKAAQEDSVATVKWAMASALKSGVQPECSNEMKAAESKYKQLIEVPAGWDVEAMMKGFDGTGRMLAKKPVTDAAILQQMQQFLAGTIRKKYTRDRRGDKVPSTFQVTSVVSIQNEQIYQEYALKAKQLPAPGAQPEKMPTLLTSVGQHFLPPLNSAINEAWLWHGTSQGAADAITTEDFRLNLAGSSAGTMYGPGIYFSDSCSKSDEYTKPGSDDVRCLLLCRVSLGRVLYSDAVSPDQRMLTQKCLSGEYDSVFGDREKCRGTFKEFIVFDDDQAYPEYVIYYKRVFEDA